MDSARNPPAAMPWGSAPHDGPALWEDPDPAFAVAHRPDGWQVDLIRIAVENTGCTI